MVKNAGLHPGLIGSVFAQLRRIAGLATYSSVGRRTRPLGAGTLRTQPASVSKPSANGLNRARKGSSGESLRKPIASGRQSEFSQYVHAYLVGWLLETMEYLDQNVQVVQEAPRL